MLIRTEDRGVHGASRRIGVWGGSMTRMSSVLTRSLRQVSERFVLWATGKRVLPQMHADARRCSGAAGGFAAISRGGPGGRSVMAAGTKAIRRSGRAEH